MCGFNSSLHDPCERAAAMTLPEHLDARRSKQAPLCYARAGPARGASPFLAQLFARLLRQ